MERHRPYLPKRRGRACVDERRVLSCITFINRNGLRWCGAPIVSGPSKTLYNRWKRWSDMGVFAWIMMGLAEQAPDNKTISIDATYLKAHRTASSLRLKRGGVSALTKGGMNTKLHAVTDTSGRSNFSCVCYGFLRCMKLAGNRESLFASSS